VGGSKTAGCSSLDNAIVHLIWLGTVEKIDAKKEIDALLPHCDDVEHFIGYTEVTDREGHSARLGYVRVLLKGDGPMRDWPEQLVYRRAVEAGSGVQLFIICAPGEVLTPLIATEWEDTFQAFIDAAEKLKMFVVELVTPTKKRLAMISNGLVRDTSEHPITPEDYEFLCNGAHRDFPDAPKNETS